MPRRYWDWASTAESTIPPAARQSTISVTRPGTGGAPTRETITNPLFAYRFLQRHPEFVSCSTPMHGPRATALTRRSRSLTDIGCLRESIEIRRFVIRQHPRSILERQSPFFKPRCSHHLVLRPGTFADECSVTRSSTYNAFTRNTDFNSYQSAAELPHNIVHSGWRRLLLPPWQ